MNEASHHISGEKLRAVVVTTNVPFDGSRLDMLWTRTDKRAASGSEVLMLIRREVERGNGGTENLTCAEGAHLPHIFNLVKSSRLLLGNTRGPNQPMATNNNLAAIDWDSPNLLEIAATAASAAIDRVNEEIATEKSGKQEIGSTKADDDVKPAAAFNDPRPLPSKSALSDNTTLTEDIIYISFPGSEGRCSMPPSSSATEKSSTDLEQADGSDAQEQFVKLDRTVVCNVDGLPADIQAAVAAPAVARTTLKKATIMREDSVRDASSPVGNQLTNKDKPSADLGVDDIQTQKAAEGSPSSSKTTLLVAAPRRGKDLARLAAARARATAAAEELDLSQPSDMSLKRAAIMREEYARYVRQRAMAKESKSAMNSSKENSDSYAVGGSSDRLLRDVQDRFSSTRSSSGEDTVLTPLSNSRPRKKDGASHIGKHPNSYLESKETDSITTKKASHLHTKPPAKSALPIAKTKSEKKRKAQSDLTPTINKQRRRERTIAETKEVVPAAETTTASVEASPPLTSAKHIPKSAKRSRKCSDRKAAHIEELKAEVARMESQLEALGILDGKTKLTLRILTDNLTRYSNWNDINGAKTKLTFQQEKLKLKYPSLTCKKLPLYESTQLSTSNRSKATPVPWETRYMELLEYNRVNGHCRVPTKSSKLGYWVDTQRKNRHGMPSERKKKLNAAGFVWNMKDWYRHNSM